MRLAKSGEPGNACKSLAASDVLRQRETLVFQPDLCTAPQPSEQLRNNHRILAYSD